MIHFLDLMAVSVRNLGKIPYIRCLKLQEDLVQVYKQKDHRKVGVILTCEHDPPVYTLGLREKITQETIRKLLNLGADVVKTRRGGLITFHGIGQLVCYPILNLHKLKIGIRQYIKHLEQSVISTCQQFGTEPHTTEHTGVWIGDEKLCAIGVQVSMGVTYHGLALNCNTDMTWFDPIIPCGIQDKGVTSITKHTGKEVTISEVLPVLLQQLTKQLNLLTSSI